MTRIGTPLGWPTVAAILLIVEFGPGCDSSDRAPGNAPTRNNTPSANQAPVADAGADQGVDMLTKVTLDGRASSDPESAALTYGWSQTAGPSVTLSDNASVSPTLTAPEVLVDTDLVFSLVVNDGTQDSMAAAVTVHVKHVNRNPTVDAVSPPSPQTVNEGEQLTFTVTFEDQDGDTLDLSNNCDTYSYVTCTPNDRVINAMTVSVAPGFDVGDATFRLNISIRLFADDGGGSPAQATLAVTINDVNRSPQVVATPQGPYAVTEKSTLAPTLTFSDPDGDTLALDLSGCEAAATTRAWLKCSSSDGRNVTIAITPKTNDGNQSASFQLHGGDGKGGSTSIPIDIAIVDEAAPTVSFSGLSDHPFHVVNIDATDANHVTLFATDAPDNDDAITCAMDSSAPLWVSFDAGSAEFTFAPNTNSLDGTVTLTCTDADGSQGFNSFAVRINHPPHAAFSWTPDPLPAGVDASLSDDSTDADDDDGWHCLWESATATFSGSTGSCAGVAVVTIECGEQHDIKLTVTDAHGLTDSLTLGMTTTGKGPYVHKRPGCEAIPSRCGSINNPWCTIQEAVTESAGGTAYQEIFVSRSSDTNYNDSAADGGPLVMTSGVSLHGGYDETFADPPDRDAHATVIVTTEASGILFDTVVDVTVSGFTVLSDGGGNTGTKACMTIIDSDTTVTITDNDIDASDISRAANDTVAVRLLGNIGAILRGNHIVGGDGVNSSTGVYYAGQTPGDSFTGTITHHLAADGNGIAGGRGSAWCRALHFDGPVAASAKVLQSYFHGGVAVTSAYGVHCGTDCDLHLGPNVEIVGGSASSSTAGIFGLIGDANMLLVDRSTIHGGSGSARSTALDVVGPGQLHVDQCNVNGGSGEQSVGIHANGLKASLTARVTSSTVVGGEATSSAVGIMTSAAVSLQVSAESTIKGAVDAGSASGTAILAAGPGSVTISQTTLIGKEVTQGDPWTSSGIGIHAQEDMRLSVTGSIISGGAAASGVGIAYEVGEAPTGFAIGGDDPSLGNTISGGPLADTGLPVAGGRSFIGISISHRAPDSASEFPSISTIANNEIYGGAPNAGPGSVAPAGAAGISITGVDNILIRDNSVIQGCTPSCGGPAPSTTPYGIGIAVVGEAQLDDPEHSGGIVDNGLISGGPAGRSVTNDPLSAGLWIHATTADATPSVLATGNTIYGNHDGSDPWNTRATGVAIRGGTVALGEQGSGNRRIEGGPAISASYGIHVWPLVAPVTLSAANNDLIVGNLNGLSAPERAEGVRVQGGTVHLGNATTGNGTVQGGLSSGGSIGVRLLAGSLTALNNNRIAGNLSTDGTAPTEAEGVQVNGGTLVLGNDEAGNRRVEGGVAVERARGVHMIVRGTALVSVENNGLVAGNLDGAVRHPNEALGIFGSPDSSANYVRIVDNGGIWGGYAGREAVGIRLHRWHSGVIANNNVAGGYAEDTFGLDVNTDVGAASAPLHIERNLFEACGLYDDAGDAHAPVCEQVARSTGARLWAMSPLNFWNNRVFGGHGGQSLGVDVFEGASLTGLPPANVVAHNYINAQGGPDAGLTAAIQVNGPSGSAFTGQGVFVINNILDNGGTTPPVKRFHFHESAIIDLTGMVVLNNAFVPDSEHTVHYLEARLGSTESYYQAEIGDCSTPARCLDNDDDSGTFSATAQTIVKEANYQGNRVADPLLAGDPGQIWEAPRLLSLADFAVTQASLRDAGYDFSGWSLTGPTEDFQQETRSDTPDLGHDEL